MVKVNIGLKLKDISRKEGLKGLDGGEVTTWNEVYAFRAKHAGMTIELNIKGNQDTIHSELSEFGFEHTGKMAELILSSVVSQKTLDVYGLNNPMTPTNKEKVEDD